jgi:hypothetical protein
MIQPNILNYLNLFANRSLYKDNDSVNRINNAIALLSQGKQIEDEQSKIDTLHLLDSAIELTQNVLLKEDDTDDLIIILKDLVNLRETLY